jgi:hypothetical protein
MHGVLGRRKAWDIVFRDRASNRVGRLGQHPRILLRWLVQQYPIQASELSQCLGKPCMLVTSTPVTLSHQSLDGEFWEQAALLCGELV